MKAHGSLFSGIGGFDLAAEWMGWENLFHCEWNEFGQKVLNYYWPKSKCYGDITKTDFAIWRGRIDILTGGFPCQPYSQAGKRLGTEDARHLWPEMLRAIREIQPSYVVGENVYGLINWNGGVVFDEVQSDLENEGYEVWPVILPACSVGAPHRRDRVWFVAHAISDGRREGAECKHNSIPKRAVCSDKHQNRDKVWSIARDGGLYGIASDTKYKGLERKDGEWMDGAIEFAECITPNPDSDGLDRCDSEHEINTSERREYALGNIEQGDEHGFIADPDRREILRSGNQLGEPCSLRQRGPNFEELRNQYFTGMPGWDIFPTQPPICGGDDGIPPELVGITVSKHRKESLKAYGSAIVPQVAFQIFQAIEQCEKTKQ